MRFQKGKLFKSICFSLIFSFLTSSLTQAAPLNLTPANQFIPLSAAYSFPLLKGLKFDPANPLRMEFIVDTGDKKDISQEEAALLIKYFLAGLTTPEKDIWVNLSPYEQDRIIPEALSQTELGKDLLSQDYLLKQLTSSLTYPESETGKDYWDKTYAEVMKIAKTTKLPVNTFNKVWIVPDEAEIYESDNAGLITKARLKVMLEEDYLALKNKQQAPDFQKESKKYGMSEDLVQEVNQSASRVMKEVILPKINQEVNSGKNFATLRQIHYSLILGLWFKQKFQDTIYQHYINQGKLKGIDLEDKTIKEKIYQQYVQAFKSGLYNYIKTDKEPATNKKIKRRYYSGGYVLFPQGNSPIRVKRISSGDPNMLRADRYGKFGTDGASAGSPYSDLDIGKNRKNIVVEFGDPSSLLASDRRIPEATPAPTANSPLQVRGIGELRPELTTALIAVDWNVSLENGKINDATKIENSIPVFEEILSKTKIQHLFVMTHLGRPTKGVVEKEFSLQPVVEKFIGLLNRNDIKVIGLPYDLFTAKEQIRYNKVNFPSQKIIFVLQNIRFYPEEQSKNSQVRGLFEKRLLELTGKSSQNIAYVNEAFEKSHRKEDASMELVEKIKPENRAAGPYLQKEIGKLLKFKEKAEDEKVFIFGGAKFDEWKNIADVISQKQEKVKVVVLGALVNPFLASKGINMGVSLMPSKEEKLEVFNALRKIEKADGKIIYPEDFRVKREGQEETQIVKIDLEKKQGLEEDMVQVDIGPKTIAALKKLILSLGENDGVILNGGAGKFEREESIAGTLQLIVSAEKAATERKAEVFFAGVDMTAAIKIVEEYLGRTLFPAPSMKFSTGGGSLLKALIEGIENLPPIAALLKESVPGVALTANSPLSNIVERLEKVGKEVVVTNLPDTKVYRINSPEALPEEIKKYWDDHEALYILKNSKIGYTAYVGIHAYFSFEIDGRPQAIGGTRVKMYNTEEEAIIDVLNLPLAMSDKNILAFPEGKVPGGAKLVINLDPRLDLEKKRKVLKSLALTLRKLRVMITSTDSGTTPEDIAYMAKFAPEIIAGAGPGIGLGGELTSPWTAEGVFNGIEEAVRWAYQNKIKGFDTPDLRGKTISLQGLGGVGGILLRKLLEAGAIVHATDTNLEVIFQIERQYNNYLANQQLFILKNPQDIYKIKSQIFSPNGIGGILNKETIPLLKDAGVKIVAGAANNQLKEPDLDSQRLHKNDIFYVVDFVINAGGVLAAMSGKGGYDLDKEVKKIGPRVKEVLEAAFQQDVSPYKVAKEWAKKAISEQRRKIVQLSEGDLKTIFKIGTNGWRGLLDKEVTIDNVGRLAQAAVDELKERVQERKYIPYDSKGLKILVGYDGRQGSREFAQRILEVFLAAGISVEMTDTFATTPAVAALTRESLKRYDLAFLVTASHNDVSYNGVKIFQKGGVAPDPLTSKIAQRANGYRDYKYRKVPADTEQLDIARETLARYRKIFPNLVSDIQEYRNSNPFQEITLDLMHGSAGPFVAFFKLMGVKIVRDIPMHKRTFPQQTFIEDGQEVPYRPEPKELFLDPQAFSEFKKKAIDGSLYLAIDGDVDRLAAWVKSEGKAVELTPNNLGVLLGWYLIKYGRTGSDASQIVKTLPTTWGIDKLAKWARRKLIVTPVGSKHFNPYIRDSSSLKAIIAIEESGHLAINVGGEVFFDDAVVEAMLLLEILTKTNKGVRENFAQAYQEIGFQGVYRRQNIKLTPELKNKVISLVENPREFVSVIEKKIGKKTSEVFITLPGEEFNQVTPLEELKEGQEFIVNEGIWLGFGNDSFVQIRFSGTEPVVRIYTEAPTEEDRQSLEKAVTAALGITSSSAIKATSDRSLDAQLTRLRKFMSVNRGRGSKGGEIEKAYASIMVFQSKTGTYPTFGVGIDTHAATGTHDEAQSGTSADTREPRALSKKDDYQYEELEVFNQYIKPLLLKENVAHALEIDKKLEAIGRKLKPTLDSPDLIYAGPAITATSMAVVRSLACSANVDEEVVLFYLYNELAKEEGAPLLKEMTLPIFMAKSNDGGIHGATVESDLLDSGKVPVLPIQEFLFLPAGYKTYEEALVALREVTEKFYKLVRGEIDPDFQYGAEAAIKSKKLSSNHQVLELMTRAIKETQAAGVFIGLDVAASELYREDKGYYFGQDAKEQFGSEDGFISVDQTIEYYEGLIKDYPRIISVEDAFSEHDKAGWMKGNEKLGKRVNLVGDDVFVTAPEIVTEGARGQWANSLLNKINQAGTMRRALLSAIIARKLPTTLFKQLPWTIAVSHRSGEPANQDMMAILALPIAEFIKTTVGSKAGGGQGREAKVNSLSMMSAKWRERGLPLKYAGAEMLANPQRGFEKIVKEFTENKIFDKGENNVASSAINKPRKKIVYIVLDGVSDGENGVQEFGGKTPLEQANMPNLNSLVKEGVMGEMNTVGEGIAPQSDEAVLAILGYDNKVYPGRGAIEAAGAGIEIPRGGVVFRVNFATGSMEGKGIDIEDRRARRSLSTEEAQALANEISSKVSLISHPNAEFKFIPTVEHRGVLVIHVPGLELSPYVTNVDPGYAREGLTSIALEEGTYELKVQRVKPQSAYQDNEGAQILSQLINEFVQRSHDVLVESEVNKNRKSQGKLPANLILARDASGISGQFQTLAQKTEGMKWGMFAEVPAEIGIGKLTGMDVITISKHPNDLKKEYEDIATQVEEALEQYDGLYVHIKGPDLPAYDGNAQKKVEIIQAIDEYFLGPLIKSGALKGAVVTITADHTTSVVKKSHTADPVPVLIIDGVEPDATTNFTEKSAKEGNLGLVKGTELLEKLLSIARTSASPLNTQNRTTSKSANTDGGTLEGLYKSSQDKDEVGGIDLETIADKTRIKSGGASSPLPGRETQDLPSFPAIPVDFPHWLGLSLKIVKIEDIENLEEDFL